MNNIFCFAKRFAALCMVCFLLLAAGGCKEAAEEWTPGKPLDKNAVKIGIIYFDKAETSGYSFAHELGVRTMQQTLGLADEQVMRAFDVSDSNSMLVEHAMRGFISSGANIIFATSWGYMDICEKLAREFPGVVFAHASGYKRNDTNFTNYFGRIYEARYLGGIVAGLASKTGRIGYVAAMGKDNSEVTGGINAFALGVESVNPGARVSVWVTNSWFAPAVERQAAEELIKAGCDVIAQHCDTANPQMAAQDAGVWGIGYNTDMREQAPDAVVTSVVWHWGVYYTRFVSSVIDGTFSTQPFIGGTGDGMVGITPLNEALARPDAEPTVEGARAKIRDGSLKIFTGALRANDGTVRGTPGEPFSDEDILGGMNWYYHTVRVFPDM